MTNPQSPFVGGALDLSAVKAQAEARAQAESSPAAAPADAPSAHFFTVTEANFEQELIRRSAEVPVIALIGSPRSPASEQLKGDLSALAQQGRGTFVVGYIDADATPQVAQVFGIQNLPTTVALAAGQPVTNFEGAQPREALEKWTQTLVDKLGPQLSGPASSEPEEQPADPCLEQAETALNNGDFAAAIATYEEILAADPNNSEIKQARDTAKLLRRLNPAAREADPIQLADAQPDNVDAQLDAADAEVVAGAPERAFERLISTMKATTGDDKQRAKDRLLELFSLFDAADPRVLQARTQLASVLY